MPDGFVGFQRIVPPDKFYPCLEELLAFVEEDQRDVLAWTEVLEDDPIHKYTAEERGSLEIAWKPRDIGKEPLRRRLIGFKSYISVKRIEDASVQGVKFLTDLRWLESEFGLAGTYSFSW